MRYCNYLAEESTPPYRQAMRRLVERPKAVRNRGTSKCLRYSDSPPISSNNPRYYAAKLLKCHGRSFSWAFRKFKSRYPALSRVLLEQADFILSPGRNREESCYARRLMDLGTDLKTKYPIVLGEVIYYRPELIKSTRDLRLYDWSEHKYIRVDRCWKGTGKWRELLTQNKRNKKAYYSRQALIREYKSRADLMYHNELINNKKRNEKLQEI